MRHRTPFLAALLLFAAALPLRADEPTPTPEPAPSKITAPVEVSGTGTKLDPFVFSTATRCLLSLTGPNDGIKFDLDDAPTDTTILENRYATFSLWKPGTYQLTAYGGTVYAKAWFAIHSGTDPPAPPTPPTPPTPPDVKPVTAPVWIVILRDGATLTALPPAQLAALTSAALRDYAAAHCRKGLDGKTPEFRIYEPDTDVSRQSPGIQAAVKLALTDRNAANSKQPWIAVSNGQTGYSGPLPPTSPEIIAKLQTYAGP